MVRGHLRVDGRQKKTDQHGKLSIILRALIGLHEYESGIIYLILSENYHFHFYILTFFEYR